MLHCQHLGWRWFKFSVFGELLGLSSITAHQFTPSSPNMKSLNHWTMEDTLRREKIARHSANPLIHCLTLPSDWTMHILVQLAAEAARTECTAHRKAVKKQARSENDQPASNLASILSQARVTTQPWIPLSPRASQSGRLHRPLSLLWCPCPATLRW